MGSAAGANTVVGYAEESTYGTFVAPSRFIPFLSEGLKFSKTVMTSKAIRGGLRQAPIGSFRRETMSEAAGDVKSELTTTGWGLLFKHLLGAVATTNVGAAYTHTFTPGAIDGKSLSVHKQLIDGAGALVRAFQYPGSKLASFELEFGPDKMAEVTLEFDSRDEVANTTPYTATFSAGARPFSYIDAALTLDGVAAAAVTTASLKIANPLDNKRRFIGAGGKKSEQFVNEQLLVSGKINAEFPSGSNLYDKFRSDTPTPAVFSLTFPDVIPTTAVNPSVAFTIPDLRFTGDSPTVDGLDTIKVDHEFIGVWNQSANTITIVYVTSDATP